MNSSAYRAATIVYMILCFIAVFSQLLVFIFYKIYINLSNNFACRLIVNIILIDIMNWTLQIFFCLFHLVTKRTIHEFSEIFCICLAYFNNFLFIFTLVLILLITLSIYIQIIYRTDPCKYERHFYIFAFFYSTVISTIPLIIRMDAYDELDEKDFRCWIKDDILRIIAFYMHIWIVFILGLFFIIKSLLMLQQKIFQNLEKSLIKKLSWIPILSLIFWLEPSIYNIIYRISDKKYDLDTDLIHFFLIPIQGIANSIVFGCVNEEVKKKLQALLLCDIEELRINNSFVVTTTIASFLSSSESIKSGTLK